MRCFSRRQSRHPVDWCSSTDSTHRWKQEAATTLGHVSEIADAERPHTPRGCPFQAWSLGELIRLDRIVLAEEPSQTSAHLSSAM
jgi:glycogen debranching enzyme